MFDCFIVLWLIVLLYIILCCGSLWWFGLLYDCCALICCVCGMVCYCFAVLRTFLFVDLLLGSWLVIWLIYCALVACLVIDWIGSCLGVLYAPGACIWVCWVSGMVL